MKRCMRVLATLSILTLPVTTVAEENPSDLIQMGAYVASDNMATSEAFYKTLFDRDPIIKLDNFIAFDVAGGIFAIAKREVYAPGSVPGTGAARYIHSTDLTAVQARIEKATGKDAPEIIVEPGIHLLKVTDPDGQLVEFFSLTGG